MKPKNCKECKHSKGCKSYYGGLLCKYKDKIISALLLALLIFNITSVPASAHSFNHFGRLETIYNLWKASSPQNVEAKYVHSSQVYNYTGIARLQGEWDEVENAVYYEVLFSRDENFKDFKYYKATDNLLWIESDEDYFSDDNHVKYMKVRAVFKYGIRSPWSEVESIGCGKIHR